MSGDMAQVVAQLREVCERLSAAAVTTMRANADAQESHDRYKEASKGTNHPRITQTVADIKIAADKTAKIARLLEQARANFDNYLNAIAPGSRPNGDNTDQGTPSGERLVREAEKRADTTPSWVTFARKAVRNAENIQDSAKTVAEAGEKAFKIFRNPSGPSGSQSTGTPTIPSASIPARPKIDVPDTFGHLIIIGVIAVAAAQKADQVIRRGFARLRKR